MKYTFQLTIILLAVVAAGLMMTVAATVVALDTPVAFIQGQSPDDDPGPLPEDCDGVAALGDPIPVCCAFGYVYYAGQPVADAQVVIKKASGVSTTTTGPGFASDSAYFLADLSKSPLNVAPGDTITVTAIYDDKSATTSYSVIAGGQQVDVVIPSGADDQPPIATINYIQPVLPGPGPDTITFAGSGADADTAGAGVVAWEWSSDLDGVLSNLDFFTLSVAELAAGAHTISLQVQDDEGNWSNAVERTVGIAEFDLNPGWNVVVASAENYDAATFLEEIEAQGGQPKRLRGWRTDRGMWVSYDPDLPFAPFPLVTDAPYLVEVDGESQLRLFASARAPQCGEIGLSPGWNFVTYRPCASPQTPEQACIQIAEQGGSVKEIMRWNAGWASHPCGTTIGNTPLTSGEGVFIRSNANSAWTPWEP